MHFSHGARPASGRINFKRFHVQFSAANFEKCLIALLLVKQLIYSKDVHYGYWYIIFYFLWQHFYVYQTVCTSNIILTYWDVVATQYSFRKTLQFQIFLFSTFINLWTFAFHTPPFHSCLQTNITIKIWTNWNSNLSDVKTTFTTRH